MSNQQFTVLPNFRESLQDKGVTSRAWYSFFSNLFQGRPPAPEITVTIGTSPYTYTATQKGFLIVQGGTVSLVQWLGAGRGSTTNRTTGQTQGCFPLSLGDSLIITYSVAPTLIFVPQ